MTDTNAVDQAKEAVYEILKILQVAQVICVDDRYADEIQIEEVIGAAYNIDYDTLQSLMLAYDVSIPEAQDVRSSWFRQTWDQFSQDQQKKLANVILATARLDDGEDVDDLGDASILNELIPEGHLVTLSRTEWLNRKSELLEESSRQRTLYLFDQDLSQDGGSTNEGIQIITSLLAERESKGLICGLLTHTATPENQLEEWNKLSNEHSIPRDRFVVVSKGWLSRDPLTFAHMLKYVALSPDFDRLKNITQEILKRASQSAKNEVGKISIYDLDHIVFKISANEGLWEPDMLFRLHALFHRKESRRLAHEENRLEHLANQLRSVSHIPTDSSNQAMPNAWDIQREELYETKEYLNRHHLPIELGDIFKKIGSDSTKFFILLAQPCDLMVRSDGCRYPDIQHVTLAEVVPLSEEAKLPYEEELHYFGEMPQDRYKVKFKMVHQVECSILDLCVLNSDGKANMQLDGISPIGLRPALKKRFERLKKDYSKKLERMNVLMPKDNDSQPVRSYKNQIKEIISEVLRGELFKGKVSEKQDSKSIAFNCQRIGRLSNARAFGLLMSYTSCISRPAYDPDFGPNTGR